MAPLHARASLLPQVELPADRPPSRYLRLYIRREGHATFRYRVSDVVFECDEKV